MTKEEVDLVLIVLLEQLLDGETHPLHLAGAAEPTRGCHNESACVH